MERRRLAAAAIGAVVAASMAGFVAGSRITSPAEAASRTAAPEPSLILVEVEARVLSSEVVTRGTGRFGSPQKLSVPSSALKPAAGLVAELPTPGTELDEGDVVASASGRPLFVLVGERPMSRDLGPGLSGDDIRQLEDALTRLGFDTGPIDGVYDEQTSAGVEAWYLAAGYSPFTATTEQLNAIRAREADLAVASVEVTTANAAVSSAEAALTTAQSAKTSAARRAAANQRALDRAKQEADAANALAALDVSAKQAAVDLLKSGRPPAPATPAQIRATQADLDAARSNEIVVRAAGQGPVNDAQSVFDDALDKQVAATAAAKAADAVAVADVTAKQAILDGLKADPSATEGQIVAATSDLTAAQSNAATVHATGVNAVDAAESAQADAATALAQARSQAKAANDLAVADVAAKELALSNLTNPTPATSAEIAAAEHDLAVARANKEAVRLAGERSVDEATTAAADANAEVSVTGAAASAANSGLTNARDALETRADIETLAVREADLVNRRAGVQVPADEVVFVSTGPVRVADLLVVIGDPVTGSVMTVTDSVVHVDAGLALADASLVAPGMTVRLDEPALGIATDGVVSFVAPAPGTNGVDGFHVYVSIDVATPPTNLVGASVRLTIPVESSGTSVLAVPISALTLAADGSSRIQRSVDGVTEFVTVIPGLSAAGFVEVSSPDKELHAGDLVVIGIDQPGGSGSPTPDAAASVDSAVSTEASTPPTGSSGG